jgi:hypothetical protein
MRKMIALLAVFTCLCCCGQSNIIDKIWFYNSDGTWCFSPSKELTHISKEKVFVAGDMAQYTCFMDNQEWGISRLYGDSSDVLIKEPLIYDDDSLGRPIWWPLIDSELRVIEDWIAFYAIDRDTNAIHLCKVRIDGSQFYEFKDNEFRGDCLLTDGGSLYCVCKNDQNNWVPVRVNVETNQLIVLSTIPANVRDRLWIDGEIIWWSSIIGDMTLLYATPSDGGQATSYYIENVLYVGESQIFYTSDNMMLCSQNISTGEIISWNSSVEIPWDYIIGSTSQGILLCGTKGRDVSYWFLDFRNEEITQLSTE